MELQNDFSDKEICQYKTKTGKIRYRLADGTRVSRTGLRWNEALPKEKRIQPDSPEEKLLWDQHQDLVLKAARCCNKRYSWKGSMTFEDYIQCASHGLLKGIRAARFPNHPNPRGYLSSYCLGYIRHEIHRNSRMIRPNAEAIRTGAADMGHQNLETYGDDFMRSSDDLTFSLPDDYLDFVQMFTPAELESYGKFDKIPSRLLPIFDNLQEKYYEPE